MTRPYVQGFTLGLLTGAILFGAFTLALIHHDHRPPPPHPDDPLSRVIFSPPYEPAVPPRPLTPGMPLCVIGSTWIFATGAHAQGCTTDDLPKLCQHMLDTGIPGSYVRIETPQEPHGHIACQTGPIPHENGPPPQP